MFNTGKSWCSTVILGFGHSCLDKYSPRFGHNFGWPKKRKAKQLYLLFMWNNKANFAVLKNGK